MMHVHKSCKLLLIYIMLTSTYSAMIKFNVHRNNKCWLYAYTCEHEYFVKIIV